MVMSPVLRVDMGPLWRVVYCEQIPPQLPESKKREVFAVDCIRPDKKKKKLKGEPVGPSSRLVA